jgi:hypothetical protein
MVSVANIAEPVKTARLQVNNAVQIAGERIDDLNE